MKCNGKSVYVQDSSSPYYLFQPDGSGDWWITDEVSMHDCKANGYIESAYTCDCPEQCHPPSGCAGIGTWLANTGKNNFGDDAECNEDIWCPTGIWVV